MLQYSELEDDLDSIKVDCRLVDELETCKTYFTPDHNFKLCSLNIRSIGCNFDKFLVALRRLDIVYDVIVLSECWLNSTYSTTAGIQSIQKR